MSEFLGLILLLANLLLLVTDMKITKEIGTFKVLAIVNFSFYTACCLY